MISFRLPHYGGGGDCGKYWCPSCRMLFVFSSVILDNIKLFYTGSSTYWYSASSQDNTHQKGGAGRESRLDQCLPFSLYSKVRRTEQHPVQRESVENESGPRCSPDSRRARRPLLNGRKRGSSTNSMN